MKTRVVSSPAFGLETEALQPRIVSAAEIDNYDSLVAARAERTDPELAGRLDPAVHAADLHLPLRDGPIPARLYRRLPATSPRPILLWLHGGGFVGGSVLDIDYVCSRLAHLAEMTVVSLDYRLAPEHPYPAALHDTYDAMRWLADHGPLIGGSGALVAGGQSAGAALVAGACLLARDEGGPAIARQILCYPYLDFSADAKPGTWADAQYLAGQPAAPYAAPLRASTVAGLPPALIIGASRDPLRDDARAYAARLDAAGTDVIHVEYADTGHAFLNFCGILSAGQHAVSLIAADLKRIPVSP
jgi:acetyl esterase